MKELKLLSIQVELMEEIKTELAELPQEQQDHLAAYLVHLRHQKDAGVRKRNHFDDSTTKIPIIGFL